MGRPPGASIAWSVAILVAAVCLAVVALLFNAPASKQLDFEIACERFPVIGTLIFDLNQGSTELDGVVADDFHGAATNVAALAFARVGQKAAPLSATTVTLEPSAGPNNAHLEISRHGAIGRLSLAVSSPAELTTAVAGASTAPTFTVESHAENDARLSIDSHQIRVVEGNRYTVQEIEPNAEIPQFGATLTGDDLVNLTLTSRGRPMTTASLAFRATASTLPLLAASQALPRDSTLRCTHAVNPRLSLDHKPVEGIAADRRVTLAADYSTATLASLDLRQDPEKRSVRALFLSGTATTTSLRIDGRELIATRLEEILNEPVATRTAWLMALGALAAVSIKLVDHALSVLLDYWIPKG